MAITLGNFVFDDSRTVAVEKYAEVGGREARVIELRGVIEGLESSGQVESALDAILKAASDQGDAVPLVLRPGRRLYVRRNAFTREVIQGGGAGRFLLVLEAQDPYESAEMVTAVSWVFSGSGQTTQVSTGGNVFALPIITAVAEGVMVRPAFSDGVRQIRYEGSVGIGQVLIFDGAAGKVTLGGEDVTPYTTGYFPQVAPGGTVLTYTDSSPAASNITATVAYRDRWW
jgi:hypothetical protein